MGVGEQTFLAKSKVHSYLLPLQVDLENTADFAATYEQKYKLQTTNIQRLSAFSVKVLLSLILHKHIVTQGLLTDKCYCFYTEH